MLLEASAGVTLGMRHDRAYTTRREPVDERQHLLPDRAGRGLEQDPATPVERNRTQLRCAKPVGGEMSDLAPLRDPHAHAAVIQHALEARDPCRKLLDSYVMVVANMWCRADDRDAVALGFARHSDAVGKVKRSIVERRQNVAVKVDHRAGTLRRLLEICSDCVGWAHRDLWDPRSDRARRPRGPLLGITGRRFVPVVIGEIVAGIVGGRTALGLVDPTNRTVSFLGEVGFAMLMLSVGMHLPLRDPRLAHWLRHGALLAAIVGVLAVPAAVIAAALADRVVRPSTRWCSRRVGSSSAAGATGERCRRP
jgi:hypothetical protein